MGLRDNRGRLSIRTKLFLLVATVISASLAADIYLGSSLLFEDKVSYIYDANSSGLKAVADVIESRIQGSLREAGFLVSLPATYPWQSPAYSGIAILRAESRSGFTVEKQVGKSAVEVRQQLDRLGWEPELYERSSMLLGDPQDGEIAIGAKALDARGAPIALLAFANLSPSLLQDVPREAAAFLLDSQGKIVSARSENSGALAPAQLQELLRLLPPGPEVSGTRFWTASDSAGYLISYRRFAQGRVTLLSATPQSLAMDAAYTLARRSVLIGVGLLAMALGTSLLWARSMVLRLRQLWEATQKVMIGDFSFRLQERVSRGDELSDLAASFNLMSTRITGLMAETAEKARMESELATAQAFQKGFFPEKGFENADVSVAGRYVPASECAGDWWHHAEINGRLLLVMGDVTGHGASAAMLTAVVQGAYSHWVESLRARPEGIPDLENLVRTLNLVFHQSGRGRSLMTFLAISIDLATGLLEMASASHLNPYLYRQVEGSSSGAFERIFPMICAKSPPPLGLSPVISVSKSSLQLLPGDRIFAFTDGFKDGNNGPESKPLNKRHLLRLLDDVFGGKSGDAEALCVELLASRLQAAHSALSDDMTILVAAVQPGSHWGRPFS